MTMKTLALAFALSLAIATPAVAGPCPKGMPRIVGMDYDHARAELISRGFLPVMPKNTCDIAEAGGMGANLGYAETSGVSNRTGAASFYWHGFTVEARECEGRCIVRKVICP